MQEKRKKRVYSWELPEHSKNLTAREFGDFWWRSSVTLKNLEEPFNAESVFSGILNDLSGCYFNDFTGNLYVLSHESSKLVEVTTSGQILSELKLSGAPQFEGVTMNDEGDLFLVSEPYYLKIYKKD